MCSRSQGDKPLRFFFLLCKAALAGLVLAVFAALPWGVGGDGHARADVRNPTGVALIIGNKNYEAVGEVKYAHRDAEAFRRYVIDVLGFDPFNVRVLKDGSLGKMCSELGMEGERGLLHKYVERYSRQNNGEAVSDVVVFYSGHGMPSLNRNEPGTFLLPVDADPHHAALNGYSTDELYRVLAAYRRGPSRYSWTRPFRDPTATASNS